MPLTFPLHLFNPSSIKSSVQGRVITSPQSISGVGQVLRTDGGGFRIVQLAGIALNTNFKLRLAAAWEAELGGGITRVNVPLNTLRLAPRPLMAGKPGRPGGVHNGSTDPYFPEVTGYGNPLIIATISAAAFRATTVTLNITEGSRVQPGQTFSVNHAAMGHRAYVVRRVLSRNGQSATVLIDMPLRQAITADMPVNFDWPMVESILVPDTDVSQDISYGRRAEVSYVFREAF
jgi:hypothetical protein